jgi:hypothetical protein
MAWEVVIGSLYVSIPAAMVIIYGILICYKGRSPDDGRVNDVQSGDNVPTRGGILYPYGGIWPALAYVFLGTCFLFQDNYGFVQKVRCIDAPGTDPAVCNPADIISTPWVQWLFTAIGSVSICYIYAAFFSRFASGGATDNFTAESNGAGTVLFRLLTVAAGTGGYIFYIFVSLGVEMNVRWGWFGLGTFLLLASVFVPLYATWNVQWGPAEHLVFWPYLIFTLAHIPVIIVSTDILGRISTEYSQISYLIVNLVHFVFWVIIAWQVVSTSGIAVALSEKMPMNKRTNYVQMQAVNSSSRLASKASKKATTDDMDGVE